MSQQTDPHIDWAVNTQRMLYGGPVQIHRHTCGLHGRLRRLPGCIQLHITHFVNHYVRSWKGQCQAVFLITCRGLGSHTSSMLAFSDCTPALCLSRAGAAQTMLCFPLRRVNTDDLNPVSTQKEPHPEECACTRGGTKS